MNGSVKHAHQTALANNPAYDVSADAWNAAHTLQNVGQTSSTIAELRGLTGTTGETILVLGYYAVGDGGGGPVRYWSGGQPAGTYTDNGGSIIVPTGGDGSGAWLLNWKGPLEDRWFGTKADGLTDDSTALQAAIGASYGYGTLKLTGLSYLTTVALIPAAPLRIQGTIAAPWNTNGTKITTTGNIDTFDIKGNNVEISGIEFDSGYNAIHLDATAAQRIGLWVHDCSFKEVTHYAIWIDALTNNVTGKIIIERNLFEPTTATPTAFIECNASSGNLTALVIDNNVFEYRAARFIEITAAGAGNIDIDSIRANYCEALTATTTDIIYVSAGGTGTINWHCAIRDCTFNCDNIAVNAVNIVSTSSGTHQKPALNHNNVQTATVKSTSGNVTGEIMGFTLTDNMLFSSPISITGGRQMGIMISHNFLGANATLTNCVSADISHNEHVSITITDTGTMDALNIVGNFPRYSGATLTLTIDNGTTSKYIAGNVKYVNQAFGTATILGTLTSVSVTHGLVATPSASKIFVTPLSTLNTAAKFYVGTISSTTFMLYVDAAPTTAATFAWSASV